MSDRGTGRARASAGPSQKRPAVLAREIALEILDRGWPVGASLGTEPEIAAKYAVSRGVVRQAVRILENEQIATMRRGQKGGLIVAAPDGAAITTATALLLEYERISAADLVTVRLILELPALELAIDRIDHDGAQALRDALDGEVDASGGPSPAADYSQLHRRIGQLSGNRAIEAFVDVLAAVSAAHTVGVGHAALFDQARSAPFPPGFAAQTHVEHRRIVEAMLAKDKDTARNLMTQHLQTSIDLME